MTLDERIARAVEAEAGVVSVYLFGSHAKGRAHRDSDVDVGVLLDRACHPSSAGRFEVRVRLSSLLEHALAGSHPDVVVLNDVPPGLAASIVTTGRRVYVSDEAADRSFRRDAQLRAADLAPFLRRTRHLKLEAIRRA